MCEKQRELQDLTSDCWACKCTSNFRRGNIAASKRKFGCSCYISSTL